VIKKCQFCKNNNIIKKGKNNDGKQRYFCKDCKKHFQLKILSPSWVDKAYNDYTNKCMFLKDLSIKYNKSIPTLTKYFDILNHKIEDKIITKANERNSTNLIFDGTFFKRK
jgi:hypothetical protein